MKTLYPLCSVESVRAITVDGEDTMRDRQACKDAGGDISVEAAHGRQFVPDRKRSHFLMKLMVGTGRFAVHAGVVKRSFVGR